MCSCRLSTGNFRSAASSKVDKVCACFIEGVALAIELDLPPQKVRVPLAQRLVASPFHSSYLSNICTMLSSSIAWLKSLQRPQIAKWYDNRRAKIKRLERQHDDPSADMSDSHHTPDGSDFPSSSSQAQDTGDETDIMQAMAVASSFVEMRQRQDGNLRSSCDDEHSGASSDDEVVAASALQLQLQSLDEQARRLQEQPHRTDKHPRRSATPPDGATRTTTPCVSGGGTGRQRRMLERDGDLAGDPEAKLRRTSSAGDVRILMR